MNKMKIATILCAALAFNVQADYSEPLGDPYSNSIQIAENASVISDNKDAIAANGLNITQNMDDIHVLYGMVVDGSTWTYNNEKKIEDLETKVDSNNQKSIDRDIYLENLVTQTKWESVSNDTAILKMMEKDRETITENSTALLKQRDALNTYRDEIDDNTDAILEAEKRDVTLAQEIMVNTDMLDRQSGMIEDNMMKNEDQDTKIQENRERIEMVNDESITRDQELSKQISVTQEYTEQEVARLDEYNDYQDRRMTVAEQELYSTTYRSISNEKRIGVLEDKVSGLEDDVNRLDGMIAAQQAANSMILPRAKFAIGVGVGYYRDHTGLALGAMHVGEGYSVKATVSGTDADQWKDVAVGVGVNFIVK